MSVFCALATNPLKPAAVDAAVTWLGGKIDKELDSFIMHYSQKIGEVVDFLHKMQHYHKNYTDLKDDSKSFFDRLADAFSDGKECEARRMLGCVFNIDAGDTDSFFIVLGSLFRHLLEYDVCRSMSVTYLPNSLQQIENQNDFRFNPSSWMWLESKPSLKCLLTAFATSSVTPPSWPFACLPEHRESFPLLKTVLDKAKIGGQGDPNAKITLSFPELNNTEYKVKTLSGFCNSEDCDIFSALIEPVAEGKPADVEVELGGEDTKFFRLKRKDGIWVCNADTVPRKNSYKFYEIKLGYLPEDTPVVAYARVSNDQHVWIVCTHGDSKKASMLFRIEGAVDKELFTFYRDNDSIIKRALERFLNDSQIELNWDVVKVDIGAYRPTSLLPSEPCEGDVVGGEIIAFTLRLVWEMACKEAAYPFVEAPLNAFGKDSRIPKMLPQPSMAFREFLKGSISDIADVPVSMQDFSAHPGKATRKALHSLVENEMARAPRALSDLHSLYQTFTSAARMEKERQLNVGAEILALLCVQFVDENPTNALRLDELQKTHPEEFEKQQKLVNKMLEANVRTGASDDVIAASMVIQGGAEKLVNATASKKIAEVRERSKESTRNSARILAKRTMDHGESKPSKRPRRK